MQFPCNKSKEEQIIYGDGGLKTLRTMFVSVGSSIWDSDSAHIRVIESGSQRSGKGGTASRCLAHSRHAHPLAVPAYVLIQTNRERQ